jgi:plasmid replication initiation protein
MDTLFDREITIDHKHPETGEPVKTTTLWISSKTYSDGLGYLAVRFAPLVIPFITRLSADHPYTPTDLKLIGKLTSGYAIRIYELAKQYQTIGVRTITIAELRKIFDLKDEYEDFANLRRRVIDPAIKQINQFTDIKIGTKDELYKQNRRNRKIDSITFKISSAKAKLIKQNALPSKTLDKGEYEFTKKESSAAPTSAAFKLYKPNEVELANPATADKHLDLIKSMTKKKGG